MQPKHSIAISGNENENKTETAIIQEKTMPERVLFGAFCISSGEIEFVDITKNRSNDL